jgi:hypothetical protein
MARQRKTLPARRRNAMDDSLLIRSAESLGRVIGSLQRQLDAARQVVNTRQVGMKADTTRATRGNGQVPVRERNVKMKSAAKKKSVVARKPSATKRRPPKTR